MYRRLKNILGVSLMILAVVISQVPMPDAQAEVTQKMSETQTVEETLLETATDLAENASEILTGLEENAKTMSAEAEENSAALSTEPEESPAAPSTEPEESPAAPSTEPEESPAAPSTELEESPAVSSTEPEESPAPSTEPEESSDPDQKYTVTFVTGISGVNGEKREVLHGRTVSELVSVNGNQSQILRKGIYQVEQDDGKQEIVYTFAGWYRDNNYTAEWDFANDTIEQDTTIYAKWDRQTKAYFYVIYRAAEGSENATNIPEKQKLYADDKLKKPTKKPSLKNKNFKGWYTNPSDAKSEFKAWGKPLTKDITLYALFAEKSNTVVFHMNGGGFTGKYNGKSYTDTASLTAKITTGEKISSTDYPGSGSTSNFKYSNFSTDSNWYKDKECLQVYEQDAKVKGDLTLYKKWYYTSSGFTMNATGAVLYKYSASVADVKIPDSVKIIGNDAFTSMGSIASITLPDNISEVQENAFRGVKNVSKDITITGKTESAKNIAKRLANQYTRFVYKESDTDDSVVVSRTASGSIQLGATISGSNPTTQNNTKNNTTTVTSPTSTMPSISAPRSEVTVPSTQISQPEVTIPPTSIPQPGVTTQPTSSTSVPQPMSTTQSSSGPQSVRSNITSSSQQSTSDSFVSADQSVGTTQKTKIAAANAPKSTAHIKDSTPKTGDPVQYRMLIVCAMFSVGALLVLTGNGRRKKSSAF